MTIILDLAPEVERVLFAQAQAKGVSLVAHAQGLLSRASGVEVSATPDSLPIPNLYELFAPIRGLFTDQEIEDLFRRGPSPCSPAEGVHASRESKFA
jgi:hypothetical protein